MYSVHVATTDDREAPLDDDWPGLTWERLCDVLRVEVSPRAAALFAEPIADPARGLTHWHVTANEDPKPLAALAPQEQRNLLADFEATRADILAAAERLAAAGGESRLRLAAALRAAVAAVDPHSQLWSAAGAPVLVGWARRKSAAMRPAARIVARTPAPAPGRSGRKSVAVSRPRTAGGGLAVPMAARLAWRGDWSWLWWLPFVALVATIYYLLLPACAIELPLLGVFAGRCPAAAADDERSALAVRNDELRRRIFEAERSLALAPLCPRKRAETETRAPVPPSGEEAKERARVAKLPHGRMDVTLAWTGREDLDLHVYCADGQLYFGALNACGGTLDHDANRSGKPLEERPIEHAIWAQEPPPGEYHVQVVYYGSNGAEPRVVPFTVVVRDGAGERVYNGRVDGENKEADVVSFRR